MKLPRTYIPATLKRLVQKEIHSQCPLCGSVDVGSFEIHHIDSNPANSVFQNLIMLCPTCHAKIEKGDISKEKVLKVKQELFKGIGLVEFVSAVVDDRNCNWKISPKNEHAFYEADTRRSAHPIINFSLINHSSRVVILKTIEILLKELPRGISGLLPEPRILKPSVQYSFSVEPGKLHKFPLTEPLSVPAKESFMFQVELSIKVEGKKVSAIDGRAVTFMTCLFSDDIKVVIPTLHFNCQSENEQMVLRTAY